METLHPLSNLRQSFLAFAGGAERPSPHAKAKRVVLRDAVLFADAQSPSGMLGDRRWLVAKDMDERGETQRLGEGQRVPECLGISYRCPQLIEGPIRVTEYPGYERQEELA